MSELLREMDRFLLPSYKRADVLWVRGQGTHLWDDKGEKYLDFGSGIAVCALGHCSPLLNQILSEQSEKLWHCSNLYHSEPAALLARALIEVSPFASRVFFCNSGTEANEAALKFARKVGKALRPSKINFIAFENGFHGRSVGSLSLTHKTRVREPFLPLLDGVKFAKLGDIDSLRNLMNDDVCAVFVEPIQGEGGLNVASSAFLKELRELCSKFNALLVFDEVQCGLGRSGKMWAHEWAAVYPDLLTVAKPLGGGLPLGACLVSESVAARIEAGDHGSTFGGNPIACAVGLKVLEAIRKPEFLQSVLERSAELETGLIELKERHPKKIKALRGLGLMWGLDLEETLSEFIVRAREREKLIVLPSGDKTLRLLPPLNVSREEIVDFLSRMERNMK